MVQHNFRAGFMSCWRPSGVYFESCFDAELPSFRIDLIEAFITDTKYTSRFVEGAPENYV